MRRCKASRAARSRRTGRSRGCAAARAPRASSAARCTSTPRPASSRVTRVVNREGRLAPAFAFGGAQVQRDLLAAEGVEAEERGGLYFVDLARYGWQP